MGMSRVVRSGASSPLLQGVSCGAHIIYVFRGQGQGWGPFFVECRFNTIKEDMAFLRSFYVADDIWRFA